MTEAQKRQAMVEAVRFLEDKGLNQGTAGNISLRHGDRTLITPTGASGATLRPEGIVTLGPAGEVIDTGIPSSEWRFHIEILRYHPTAQAVVHTHADACVALSCLRRPIPAFHYMIASFGGNDVRCADYAPFGSKALATSIVAALNGRRACLIANHGMIVTGNSLAHALALTEKLETLARQYILALSAGTPVLLSPEEMAEVHKRYGYYGKSILPE